jgi:hypothetical protein
VGAHPRAEGTTVSARDVASGRESASVYTIWQMGQAFGVVCACCNWEADGSQGGTTSLHELLVSAVQHRCIPSRVRR